VETQKGGGTAPPALSEIVTSTAFNPEQVDECLEHIRISMKRDNPVVSMCPPNGEKLIIVAGGPSLKGELENLRATKHKIFTVNECHDFLIENGIIPWGSALSEVAELPEDFIIPKEGIKYFLASQSAPKTFNNLKGFDVTLWHAWQGIGEDEILPPGTMLIAGGFTTALRCLNLGYVLGHRNFEIYGLDSSFAEDTHSYKHYTHLSGMEIWCAGRVFKTLPALARQANEFREFCKNFHHLFKLKTHGDGLIQHIHRTAYPQFYEV